MNAIEKIKKGDKRKSGDMKSGETCASIESGETEQVCLLDPVSNLIKNEDKDDGASAREDKDGKSENVEVGKDQLSSEKQSLLDLNSDSKTDSAVNSTTNIQADSDNNSNAPSQLKENCSMEQKIELEDSMNDEIPANELNKNSDYNTLPHSNENLKTEIKEREISLVDEVVNSDNNNKHAKQTVVGSQTNCSDEKSNNIEYDKLDLD